MNFDSITNFIHLIFASVVTWWGKEKSKQNSCLFALNTHHTHCCFLWTSCVLTHAHSAFYRKKLRLCQVVHGESQSWKKWSNARTASHQISGALTISCKTKGRCYSQESNFMWKLLAKQRNWELGGTFSIDMSIMCVTVYRQNMDYDASALNTW